MSLSRSAKTPFCLLLSLLIYSCGGDKPAQGSGKYGMMDNNIPEYAALQFFEHIYRDPTITQTLKYASPKMARLIRSYRINRNVQRHVLNMAFDTVEMKPNAGNAGRNEFAKEARVTLFFEGMLNGNKVKDLRTIKLVRINKKWKVDEVSLE
ncbi:MAG: hypothetical protein ACI9C4_003292 [Paraglaciecola sp.]|jgi:hypothetical protein